MVSLYEYRFHEENDLLGDGREIGNLIEYIERFCENTTKLLPDKFEDIEDIINREDFFQYLISEIVAGNIITMGSMEIFPELCGNELMQVKDKELFVLFCTVMNNYFHCLYNNTDWEFVDLKKYKTYSDERIFIGEAKLHIDGNIEIVIYTEPIDMFYDDDSIPTGNVEYIEAVHSSKNVDAEIKTILRKRGIIKNYRYYKEIVSDEYSSIAEETCDVYGAEIHDSDLFIYMDRLVGDIVYSDCMLVIEGYKLFPQNHLDNYLDVNSKWQTIENRSLYMTFREFLIDGCKMDELNYNGEAHTIQIHGNGHFEISGSSVVCDIMLGFTRIKLFWNAEYDDFSGEKLTGTHQKMYGEETATMEA